VAVPALLALPAFATAAVQVLVGPTPILDGEAKSAGDITVANEKLAFTLAVSSPVPYGVPRGAIIDVAPVRNGAIGRDCVVFADFIPDNWSAWPNTYQHIDILENAPQRAVVRTVRDWGKVVLITTYTLESNADAVRIDAVMKNEGGTAAPNLLSGLTLWPKGGYFFGLPGMAGVSDGRIEGALADRAVAYDETWSVALHAPYADHISHGSLDMYQLHSLKPGESRQFTGWLEVGSRGDLKPVIAAEIARKSLASGTVRGSVAGRDGKAVEAPVVVIEKQGKPYGWVVGDHGEYQVALPAGDYALYATARNYSQSDRIPVEVVAGGTLVRDFRDLQLPGRLQVGVTNAGDGKPMDARLHIVEGQKPLVEYLGRSTFFTELDRKGRLEVPIAPGSYRFTVSAGGGFLSKVQTIALTIVPGESRSAAVSIAPLFDTAARHWYSADLHHHADQAEAVTPPADLARSQLAAGLDVLFVSDHDSTVNHGALRAIAARRGVPFIPGIELSASWGHFNAYPLLPNQNLAIDTATASIQEILREGRRQGALVMQVNHPFIAYGYFTSVSAGVAPGGFDPGFDLMEINEQAPADDGKVLEALWKFWNEGRRYYLAAGTDTHDVWHDESGAVRTFAHIDGPVTAEKFALALKAGHGYVTSGPLVFPSPMLGDTLTVSPGNRFNLDFDLGSVDGLKQAQLVRGGAVIETRTLHDALQHAHLEFPLTTTQSTWYSLIVEDIHGHKAYTDPIWVRTDGTPPAHAPKDSTNR
jgi:hypothetical protein